MMLPKSMVYVILILFGVSMISCSQLKQPGEEFTIRSGVNVSHWLSQSGKRGEARLNYITKADFDTIAAMGFDHVRIPVDEEQLWDSLGTKEAEAFELLHNALTWAAEANLRAIVDMHIIRSHYFIAESNALWTDSAEQDKLVDLWMQLSDELKQYPNNLVAYEILNEAVADDPEDWNNLVAKVVAAIRVREPERTIVIGSNRWQIADTFPQLKVPENDSNIILSFHFYTPMPITHHKASWTAIAEYSGPVHYPGQVIEPKDMQGLSEKALAMLEWSNGYFTKDSLEKVMMPAMKVAQEKNLPLFCGEFGVYPTIDDSIRLQYYKDLCDIFKRNNIAYCHWCYKGDFPVVGENSTPQQPLASILTAK
ncbi:glycoside hydrolase family 5 protein [candidate division KSB1 bacterium]|nr:glycoside hydrolase family 5 protein [candidate division KSB1 bacterium]